MFRDVETRARPALRTDTTVSVMVSLTTGGHTCFGHKGQRFLRKWIGVDWSGSVLEVMHDRKTFCDMLLKGIVGHGQHGMYKSWGKDDEHREDCAVYDIFPEFYQQPGSLPPWRLSKRELATVDARILSMWWPHYTDLLFKKDGSFWKHSDTMWKCAHKRYVLMVLLPTCLHGFVPALHQAILMIVYCMRRLDGLVISVLEALALGVDPGCNVIDKTVIADIERELVAGLVLLEGSFPVAQINPNSHHIVHYPWQTLILGLLWWFSMWSFERNNKRVKAFVRNPGQPLSSLARNIQLDIATRLKNYSERSVEEFEARAPVVCTLSCKFKFCPLSSRERLDLGMLGITSFAGARAFQVARILGVHFRCGEWGQRRCGSVVTFIYAEISRYCIVERFLRIQGKSFARVRWLSKPHYPYFPNKLVVQVSILGQCKHSCVIGVERIEPTSVAVLPHPDRVHFFMMRDKGYDRHL